MTLQSQDRFDKLLERRGRAAVLRDEVEDLIERIDKQIEEYLSEKYIDSVIKYATNGTGAFTSSGQGNDLPRGGTRGNDQVRYYRGSTERDQRSLRK